MRHFFLTVLGTIVGIFAFFFILFIFLVILGAIGGATASMKAKDSYVLSLDLRKPLRDHTAGKSLFGPTPGLSLIHI